MTNTLSASDKSGVDAYSNMENNIGTTSSGSKLEAAPLTQDVPESSTRHLHGWKWAIAYASIATTIFLFALDNTIVAAVQPSILESLDNAALLPWIGTGFALGSTAILPWGKAYGVFTIKWLFIFNVLLFELGSVVCGAAPHMTAFIIGRVVAGVGGSGMYSGSLSYIAILTSLKERPIYMAGVALVWGLGSVLGPVIGGAFATSNATWRWAFYINLVIGALFAPSYLWLLPGICLQPTKPLSQRLRQVDLIGTTVFLGGAVCFTMAISFSGSVYSWDSGSAITLWVMTGLLLIATIVLTLKHPLVTEESRLIPAHFFRSFHLVNLGLQMFFVSGIMLSGVYYVPLFFAFTKNDEAMQAGIRLLPFIALLVFTSLLNGVLMSKYGYYTPWYIIGSGLSVIGSALMITVRDDTNVSNIYGYTILVGAGAGCYLASGFAVMQSFVPVHDIPSAIGFQAIGQILGTVTFLSVCGSLFANTAVKLIMPLLPAGTSLAAATDIITGTHSLAFQDLDPEVSRQVVSKIAQSMQNVWSFNLAGSALSFVLSLFLKQQKLSTGAM
ncbi:mfs drug efflux transporter [Alternaria burnsii]|uniref:Mfs drug efflux transporter n=1 Tax=Alternaria burnsii TaxID=1187904 RepID=A0A8H7EJ85_9PLEO|nr:mfs drug efflux transporter [Alternaria burnsii]KAF7681037.1 mfs drug efflux transporter [Alternaria burnsii]